MSQENRKSQMTPLWVISLFLSLTEAVTGLALTQSSGGIQLGLIVFVIGFPLLIAGAFFAILWNRPYVLYPPTEYGPEVRVQDFVGAMHGSSATDGELLKIVQSTFESSIKSDEFTEIIREAIGGKELIENQSNVPPAQIAQIVDAISEKTLQDFEKQVLSIDLNEISYGKMGIVYRPYYAAQFVSVLLNGIYSEISQYVPADSYGTKWILEDKAFGQEFNDIGSSWADEHGDSADLRSLKEVGIDAGRKLTAITIS